MCVLCVHVQTHSQVFAYHHAHREVKGLHRVSSWFPPCRDRVSLAVSAVALDQRLAALPSHSRSNGVPDNPAASGFHLGSKDQTLVTKLARLVTLPTEQSGGFVSPRYSLNNKQVTTGHLYYLKF